MMKFTCLKAASVFLVFCTATTIAGFSQSFKTLLDFNDANGANPLYAPLVQGLDGGLYGTTEFGGSGKCSNTYVGCGIVFEVTSGGTRTLHSFLGAAEGQYPLSGVILATDGNFYGTTQGGGRYSYGTIFRMSPSGELTTLHAFDYTDGAYPYANLVQATDGNFYGATGSGGMGDSGTVFKITPAGTLQTLHAFNTVDGSIPNALVQATDGNLYGTTLFGGAHGSGTVFRVTTTGTLSTIYSFCSQPRCADGAQPSSPLIQAPDGNLYGTTVNFGPGEGCNSRGCGTVFRVTLDGVLTTLHTFESTDGAASYGGLVFGSDGNFYGTTAYGGNVCPLHTSCGTLFRMTPDGILTTLHSFDLSDGAYPYAGLAQSTSGNFYGTTEQGGLERPSECMANGCGTIFSLSVGLGPFVSLERYLGKVGDTGWILGQGFTGTTGVSLNGTPASFTVKSDTLIIATVPPGGTTGTVTVTTPSGTLTSNVPFRVIP